MSDQSNPVNRVWFGVGFAAAALGIAVQRYRAFAAREFWQHARAERGHGAALVTGASSGIGAEFARQLAARGYDLVLVARRADRLQQLADQLHDWHGIQADALPADLTQAEDVERVCRHIANTTNLQLLVNDAGFGMSEPFASSDIEKQVDMVDLHVLANMRLMRAALPGMLEHGHGGIINVSSLASYVPLPTNANYSATKSYLTVFTTALHAELRNTGVRVQALCPGFTVAEFHGQFDNTRRERIPRFLWLDAGRVVRESLDALEHDQLICVPGVG